MCIAIMRLLIRLNQDLQPFQYHKQFVPTALPRNWLLLGCMTLLVALSYFTSNNQVLAFVHNDVWTSRAWRELLLEEIHSVNIYLTSAEFMSKVFQHQICLGTPSYPYVTVTLNASTMQTFGDIHSPRTCRSWREEKRWWSTAIESSLIIPQILYPILLGSNGLCWYVTPMFSFMAFFVLHTLTTSSRVDLC